MPMTEKFDWELRGVFRTLRMDPEKAFRRDWPSGEEEEAPSDLDAFYNELQFLLEAGEYGQAEDFLFQQLEEGELAFLEIGLSFYQQLAERSDEDLAAHDFSREEVEQGLADLCRRFGLPPAVE